MSLEPPKKFEPQGSKIGKKRRHGNIHHQDAKEESRQAMQSRLSATRTKKAGAEARPTITMKTALAT
jgi:hypothetical protein